MDHVDDIVNLFKAVFDSEKNAFGVDFRDIKHAIRDMGTAYQPNPNWERDDTSNTTSYDAAGHRCAYLHKYAMIHTGLVCEVLQQALQIYSVSNSIKMKQSLKLCSLGSGPGTDIVALMFVLCDKFGLRECNASLIDWSGEWSSVFDSIIRELRTNHYSVSEMVSSNYFRYKYLQADLLDYEGDEEYDPVKSADIITMIKFISAAACKDTRNMVKAIFHAMKPGAMLLFIDNAAGGFYEMLQKSAEQCGLESVFEPWKHYDYEELKFKFERYGYTSLYKTKVTVEMWKKPEKFVPNVSDELRNEFFSGENRKLWPQVGNFVEADYSSPKWVLPSANRDKHMEVNSGLQLTRNEDSFDETDHIRPQNIRLRSDSPPAKRNKGCCLIM